MNLEPRYVQIPYHVFMALKPMEANIVQSEFDAWVAWGVDMCLNAEMQPVTYMLGNLRLSDRFGYLILHLAGSRSAGCPHK